MSETEIVGYIRNQFPGVDIVVASKENDAPEVSWGTTFFFYDPNRDQPADRRFPFATIVTRDYEGFDADSNLNRPGVFRLNISVGKESFRSLFGNGNESAFDFTALDRVMPHPVYGKMFWVCVLNPSEQTFHEKVQPLLAEAYRRAASK